MSWDGECQVGLVTDGVCYKQLSLGLTKGIQLLITPDNTVSLKTGHMKTKMEREKKNIKI